MSSLARGAAALMIIGVGASSAAAQKTITVNEQRTLLKQLQAGGTQATSALNTIVQNPQMTPSVLLFLASAAAMKAQRTEDGGFLFYIAQMRRRFDTDAYPPKGTAGNDPRQALQAMSDTLGRAINPTVMTQPAVFKGIVSRMAQWEPQVPTGYSPGWEYLTPVNLSKARAAHAARKRENVQVMRGIATLISDPAYLQDFRLVQNYNFATGAARPTTAQFEAARTRLLNLEKQKGIKGPFTLVTSPK